MIIEPIGKAAPHSATSCLGCVEEMWTQGLAPAFRISILDKHFILCARHLEKLAELIKDTPTPY